MRRFVLRRVGYAAISLFLLSVTIFLFVRVTGDPTVLLVEPGASQSDLEALRHDLGLDRSLAVQYATFMRDMIHHHDQALQMAELVKDRTNRPEIVALAGRIHASQADEIKFMQTWLRERGESVPDASAHRGMDMKGTMVGMASAADMAKLATLKGTEFDRLFLSLMITHHDGALKMVDDLFGSYGAMQDDDVYTLASDIHADQTIEIERMQKLLDALGK